jgi:hypothetical protein
LARASVDSVASRSGTLTLSPLDGTAGAPVELLVSEQVLSGVSIVNCDAPIARSGYWWPPLVSSNKAPPGIPDGAGGALYTWSAARIQRFDSLGHPLWASGGVPLGSASETAEPPVIIGDGSGGAIAAWKAKVSGSATPDLRAQRVDASGQKQWGADGVWVCQAAGEQRDPRLVPDGAGGAIVAWADLRDGTQMSRIYAQRLDSSGNASWQTDGVRVATAVSSQTAPIAVGDGSGGAILAWTGSSSVLAQRVDGAGNALWAPGGIEIAAWVLTPSIVTDGAGGAIIAWNDMRQGASLPPLVGDIHATQIFATRIDGAGNQVWVPSVVPVVAGMTATWGAADPGHVPDQVTLASDGKGGAFVVWHDRRNGKDWDIYSQRLDPDGNRRWGESGVPVSTAVTDQISPAVVSDGRDGAIFAWTDYRAGNADIFVQRLGATGNRLLGANGMWLEPKSTPGDLPWRSSSFSFGGQYFPSLVPLANQRVLVTWDDWNPGSTVDIDLAGKVIEFASDVSIAPFGATVAPNGTVSFTASGGSGGGWTWSLASAASGGVIDASTGEYTAGSIGGVTDVVQVEDSFENVTTVAVGVIKPISIAPPSPTVAPRDHLRFTATGGSGDGLKWSLAASPSGGAIDPGTGEYTAGPIGGVTDVVQVEDSLGNTASASVTLTVGVSVAPSDPTLPPRASAWLEAEGGSGVGYAWSFITNASGGSIVSYASTVGVYEAGPIGGVRDVVEVADSLGNTATASIEVGAAISISPFSPTVAPNSRQDFTASGGSGADYVWLFSVDASGGSIDPATGAYTAGPKGDAVDVVYVIDSLGNRASVDVTVTPAVPSPRPAPADDPGGCGCRHGGSGGASLAFAAILLLIAPRRASRRRDAS